VGVFMMEGIGSLKLSAEIDSEVFKICIMGCKKIELVKENRKYVLS
jgi:hypothetical protein